MESFFKIDKNIHNCKLTATERGVLMVLFDKLDYALFKGKVKDDWFPCSMYTLSKELMCGRSTAISYVNDLVNKGYLQMKTENGKTTLFKITLPTSSNSKLVETNETSSNSKLVKDTSSKSKLPTSSNIELVTSSNPELPIRIDSNNILDNNILDNKENIIDDDIDNIEDIFKEEYYNKEEILDDVMIISKEEIKEIVEDIDTSCCNEILVSKENDEMEKPIETSQVFPNEEEKIEIITEEENETEEMKSDSETQTPQLNETLTPQMPPAPLPLDKEDVDAFIIRYLDDRPYIYRQGQSYGCWVRSNPSIYQFLDDNGIDEKDFERVYNKIVPKKHKELFDAKTVISYKV